MHVSVEYSNSIPYEGKEGIITLPSKIKIADGNTYSQDKLDLYLYFILESLYKKKSKIKRDQNDDQLEKLGCRVYNK